jgi:STE24 endopeptidase
MFNYFFLEEMISLIIDWITSYSFLLFYVASFILYHTWILYLEFRQMKRNADKTFPVELKGIVTKKQFNKSQAYNEDMRSFNILAASIQAFNSLHTMVIVFPFIWHKSGEWFEDDFSRLLLVVLLNTAFNLTVNVPIGLYSDFVIQARHGMNAKTVKVFFMDVMKSKMIGILTQASRIICYNFIAIYGMPTSITSVSAVVTATEESLGKYWLIIIGMIGCFTLISTFRPFYYLELFYNLKVIFTCTNCLLQPLEDKFLLGKIEKLAKEKSFPLEKVFQIDAGKRSVHSNAFFASSWFQKRVIVFDTMIATSTTDEVLAIFAHELGHWQLMHTHKQYFLRLVIGIVLFAVALLNINFISEFPSVLSSQFGLALKSDGTLPGYIIFTMMVAVVTCAIAPLVSVSSNYLSRKQEFEVKELFFSFFLY